MEEKNAIPQSTNRIFRIGNVNVIDQSKMRTRLDDVLIYLKFYCQWKILFFYRRRNIRNNIVSVHFKIIELHKIITYITHDYYYYQYNLLYLILLTEF